MPDVDRLAAFAAVAQRRSFRQAARERGVSPSTLSETVRQLEERLGVRLLNRTTRSVTPTEAGLRLLEQLVPVLDALNDALAAVDAYRDAPVGTLRLNLPTAVARLVVAPLLGRFRAAYPGIKLEIIEQNSFVDVFAAGFDAGARYDESLQPDMIAVPMGPPQRYALAASPDMLRRHGTPSTPEDLLTLPCIRFRFPSGAVLPWEFERDGRTERVVPEADLTVSTVDMGIGAAEAGLGLFYTIEGFLRPAFEAGRLVEVLEPWSVRFQGPSLYYPSRRLMPAGLKAFVAFLRAERAAGGW